MTKKQRRENLQEMFEKPLWPDLDAWIAPNLVSQRIQEVFIALSSVKNILLYVDPLHCLLGGEQELYSVDASLLLKPALARRQIHLIGGCTIEQYQHYIEQDASLFARFQGVLFPGV